MYLIRNFSSQNVDVILGGQNVTIYRGGAYEMEYLSDADYAEMEGKPLTVVSPKKEKSSKSKNEKTSGDNDDFINMDE